MFDLTKYRIVVDERLEGERSGEMTEGENEIRLSPAMFKLWQTDRAELIKKLAIKILPPVVKSPEQVSPEKETAGQNK